MKSWNGNEERLSRFFLHVFYAQSEILRASIYFSFCPSSEFKFDQISSLTFADRGGEDSLFAEFFFVTPAQMSHFPR